MLFSANACCGHRERYVLKFGDFLEEAAGSLTSESGRLGIGELSAKSLKLNVHFFALVQYNRFDNCS